MVLDIPMMIPVAGTEIELQNIKNIARTQFLKYGKDVQKTCKMSKNCVLFFKHANSYLCISSISFFVLAFLDSNNCDPRTEINNICHLLV